jgi:hypothetical protein
MGPVHSEGLGPTNSLVIHRPQLRSRALAIRRGLRTGKELAHAACT